MWRFIYVAKLPGLERKVRVLSDWTLELFFPRDIVSLLHSLKWGALASIAGGLALDLVLVASGSMPSVLWATSGGSPVFGFAASLALSTSTERLDGLRRGHGLGLNRDTAADHVLREVLGLDDATPGQPPAPTRG